MNQINDYTLVITRDELQCIEEGMDLEDEEGERDYSYKEIEKKKHYRHNGEYITFVFELDDKWWMGTFTVWEDSGLEEDDIECELVEPYEKTVVSYRRFKK